MEIESVYREERPRALASLIRLVGDFDLAEDALQEAFVKAWKSLARFDAKRPFGPWFFQILRNHCRDLLRTRASRAKLEVEDEAIEARPMDGEAGPEGARERGAA